MPLNGSDSIAAQSPRPESPTSTPLSAAMRMLRFVEMVCQWSIAATPTTTVTVALDVRPAPSVTVYSKVSAPDQPFAGV